MKTKLCNPLILIGLFLIVISCLESSGQDSISQKSQMLDIKLQLLDSKLELLDTKIKLWEAKPKELDIKLSELNSRINSMAFDPQQMTKKINEMD
jgi:chaperonin cofactor prefoldin